MAFNQKEYINNYNKEHYYSPRIRLPKHYQDILKAISATEGTSITAVIKNCIDEKCQCLNINRLGGKRGMNIEKGGNIYTIAETVNGWSIKTDISKVGVSYSIPKEICKTIDDVKKYITENDMF